MARELEGDNQKSLERLLPTNAGKTGPLLRGLCLLLAASTFYSAFLSVLWRYEQISGYANFTAFLVSRVPHDFLVIALTIYVLLAIRALRSAIEANIPMLKPWLEPDAPVDTNDSLKVTAAKKRSRVLVGLICIGVVLATGSPNLIQTEMQLHGSALLTASFQGLVLTLIWTSATGIYDLVVAATRMSLLLSTHLKVDLWRAHPDPPITQLTFQAAFIFAGGVTLAMPLLYDLDWALVGALYVSVVVVAAFAVFMLPSMGIRRAVLVERSAALARINKRIATFGDPEDLHSDMVEEFIHLLTLRREITRVQTMPFAMPALFRWSLIVLIPIGSWFGGAFVERAVDAWIP